MRQRRSARITSKANRQHRPQGSILLLAVFFMIVLSLLATAFIRLVPTSLQAAAHLYRDTESYYAADAGVVDARAFLHQQTLAGTVDQKFTGGSYTLTGNLNSHWGWVCTIKPGSGTLGNPDTTIPNNLRTYQLESVAYLNPDDVDKQAYRDVSVWLVQDSFAGGAYTVNVLPSDIWLDLATLHLEGKYMTNGKLLFLTNGAGFSWTGQAPSFQGNQTTVQFYKGSAVANPRIGKVVDGVVYNGTGSQLDTGELPYDSQGNPIVIKNASGQVVGNRYDRIATNGRDAIQAVPDDGTGNNAFFELPTNSDEVAAGAYGTTPPANLSSSSNSYLFKNEPTVASPSQNAPSINAYVNATPGQKLDSGVYIQGSVDQIDFRVDGGTLQQQSVDSSGNKTDSSPTAAQTSTYDTSNGTIQPKGTVITGGNQVAQINQTVNGTKQRLDVVYVTDKSQSAQPLVIPKGSVVNGAVVNAPVYLQGSDNGGSGDTLFRTYNPADVTAYQDNGSSGTAPPTSVTQPVDYSGDKTLPVGTYVTYQGHSNNTIYSTGDVNGVRGVIRGRRTVATDTSSDKSIYIDGDITYADTTPWSAQDTQNDPTKNGHPDPNRDPSTLSQLGLVAYDVWMASNQASAPDQIGAMWPNRNQTNATDPLFLYTSIFTGKEGDTTGGGFGTQDYQNLSLGDGNMEIFGNVTEGVRQVKGYVDESGYDYSYFYDNTLQSVQPPYYPSLPTYHAVSWEEKSDFDY